MERRGGGKLGVVSPRHEARHVGVAIQDRQLGHHRIRRGELMRAAEGPQHRAGTDGAVEHLAEAFLRGVVQLAQMIREAADRFRQRLRDRQVRGATVDDRIDETKGFAVGS